MPDIFPYLNILNLITSTHSLLSSGVIFTGSGALYVDGFGAVIQPVAPCLKNRHSVPYFLSLPGLTSKSFTFFFFFF